MSDNQDLGLELTVQENDLEVPKGKELGHLKLSKRQRSVSIRRPDAYKGSYEEGLASYLSKGQNNTAVNQNGSANDLVGMGQADDPFVIKRV